MQLSFSFHFYCSLCAVTPEQYNQDEHDEQKKKGAEQKNTGVHNEEFQTDDELVLVRGGQKLVLALETQSEPSSFADTVLGRNAIFNESIWPPSQ